MHFHIYFSILLYASIYFHMLQYTSNPAFQYFNIMQLPCKVIFVGKWFTPIVKYIWNSLEGSGGYLYGSGDSEGSL